MVNLGNVTKKPWKGCRKQSMTATSLLETELYVQTELYVHHDFDPKTFLKNEELRYDLRRRGLFAEKLLLYDTLVIPTLDCGIIPVLITWIGPSLFEELLDEGALKFCRRQSLVAYGTGGLAMIKIEPPEQEKEQFVLWGPTDKAVELQLRQTVPFVDKRRRAKLVEKVLQHTVEEPLEDFSKAIMKETYADVQGDVRLQAVFTRKHPKVDLAHLPGIGHKEVRVLGKKPRSDDIEFFLRLGEINLELALAGNLQCSAVTTDPLAQQLITAKLRRNLQIPSNAEIVQEGFCKMLKLNRLPDIPSVVAADKIDLGAVIKCRRSPKGQQFRRWLAKLEAQDSNEIAGMYVETLTKKHWSKSWPVRTIRFIITSGIGAIPGIGSIAGPTAATIDSFVLERLLKGYTPQLFLDDLRNLSDEAHPKPAGNKP